MLAGSVGAQGIVILIMPALTRLYEPSAIGIQALFVSASTLLVVVVSLRLDLAVVLAREEDEVTRLASLVFYQAMAAILLFALIVSVFGGDLERALSPGEGQAWLWLLGPMVLAGAMSQIGIGQATRHGRFKLIVASNLTLSATFAISGLVLGILWPSDSGLVIARLGGQVACLVALILFGQVVVRRLVQRWSTSRAGRVWSTHRQFVVFNTPFSLIGAFTRDFPLYLFALHGGSALAAAYALARTITLAPASLASSAMSRVFYHEAAANLGSPHLPRLASRIIRTGLWLSAPAFAFLLVWGDLLFTVVFGDEWELAGTFASILAVPLWLAMQAGWPERLYEVTGRQRVSFTIQIFFDVLHVTVLAVSYAISRSPVTAVVAFAVTYSLYHVSFLVGVHRVASFPVMPLVRALLTGTALFGIATIVQLMIRSTSPAGAIPTGIAALIFAMVSSGAVALILRKGSPSVS